jgi:hypothetical protein
MIAAMATAAGLVTDWDGLLHEGGVVYLTARRAADLAAAR